LIRNKIWNLTNAVQLTEWKSSPRTYPIRTTVLINTVVLILTNEKTRGGNPQKTRKKQGKTLLFLENTIGDGETVLMPTKRVKGKRVK
jgi:hypothetical protein